MSRAERMNDERLDLAIHRLTTHRPVSALICLDIAEDLRDLRARVAGMQKMLDAQSVIIAGCVSAFSAPTPGNATT